MSDSATNDEATDGRRAAGAETRRRLIAATADLLAAHGEQGVTLRAVSRAAEANSAAIQYHFGSRDALIAEVVGEATRDVVAAQLAALSDLAEKHRRPPAAKLVEAWATPLIRVATDGTPEAQRLGRIVGQTLAAPSESLDVQLREMAAQPTEQLIEGLDRALPSVARPEIVLRVALAASALAGLASGAFGPLLAEAQPEREIQARILQRLTRLVTAPA